jgi:DNA-binding MarR family transcriptional regulator
MAYGLICKIHEIYTALSEYEAKVVKLYGVTLNEGMLLCCLKKNGTLSSSKIAEYLDLTPSNASKIIKSAESKDLIVRTINSADKRGMLFSITTVGEECVKAVTEDTINIPAILKQLTDN